MRNLIYFLILLIVFSACEKDPVETYSTLMTLKVENDNAPADNKEEIKVTAEFPSNFTTEKDQKVDFIIGKDPEVTIQSDIVLVTENYVKKKIAVVYIKNDKASKIKVKATITANEISVVKEIEIVFKQLSPIDLMTLKVENDNALADNNDKIRVIAEFPIDFSNEEDQKVDFVISKETEVTLKGDIMIVDDNGTKKRMAETFVTSNKAGKIKVKALISVNGVKGSKETEITFKQPNIDAKMELKAQNDNAFADSFDKIKITAEFPSDFLGEEDQKVDFIINKDVPEIFKSDIMLINDSGTLKRVAEVFVTHNKATTLQVNAVIKVSGVQTSKSIQITFKRAYPDAITINSSSLQIKPNSFETVTLTSKLTRNKGTVTLNTPITTKAYDSNDNEIGIFIDYKDKTDTNGNVINYFTLGNSTYTGPIKIITKTMDVDNNSINNEITLFTNN
jgi:hypothetical protein